MLKEFNVHFNNDIPSNELIVVGCEYSYKDAIIKITTDETWNVFSLYLLFESNNGIKYKEPYDEINGNNIPNEIMGDRGMHYLSLYGVDPLDESHTRNSNTIRIVVEDSIYPGGNIPDYTPDEFQKIDAKLSGYVKEAKEYADSSKTNATESGNHSKTSESWAVGQTGTRVGEDIDNSKYYSEQSKTHSENSKSYLDEMKQKVANGELNGKDGESGVYVGSLPIPPGTKVHIDPNGSVTEAQDIPATVPPNLTAEPNIQSVLDALSNQSGGGGSGASSASNLSTVVPKQLPKETAGNAQAVMNASVDYSDTKQVQGVYSKPGDVAPWATLQLFDPKNIVDSVPENFVTKNGHYCYKYQEGNSNTIRINIPNAKQGSVHIKSRLWWNRRDIGNTNLNIFYTDGTKHQFSYSTGETGTRIYEYTTPSDKTVSYIEGWKNNVYKADVWLDLDTISIIPLYPVVSPAGASNASELSAEVPQGLTAEPNVQSVLEALNAKPGGGTAEGKWIDLLNFEVQGESVNAIRQKIEPHKKIRIIIESVPAEKNTNYSGLTVSSRESTAFYIGSLYMVKAIPTTEAARTEIELEIIPVNGVNWIFGNTNYAPKRGTNSDTLRTNNFISTDFCFPAYDLYGNNIEEKINYVSITTYGSYAAGTKVIIQGWVIK